MNYGELIGGDIIPQYDRSKVYKIFTEYFGNPTMTKVKDMEQYSIYAAEIPCLLSRENRYIFVVIPSDGLNVGSMKMLDEIEWESFQTRSLYEKHHVVDHKYIARRFPPLMIKLSLTSRQTTHYMYDTQELPITITLLPKLDGTMNYQPVITLVAALETYSTVIKFK